VRRKIAVKVRICYGKMAVGMAGRSSEGENLPRKERHLAIETGFDRISEFFRILVG
jgi:hypothetical protein